MANHSPENSPSEEQESGEPAPFPHTLDVVLIEGRFAQVAGVGTETSSVIFLDGKAAGSPAIDHIDWREYRYERPPLGLRKFVKGWKSEMPDGQYQAIIWSTEEAEKNDALRGDVTFFGTYTKKKQ